MSATALTTALRRRRRARGPLGIAALALLSTVACKGPRPDETRPHKAPAGSATASAHEGQQRGGSPSSRLATTATPPATVGSVDGQPIPAAMVEGRLAADTARSPERVVEALLSAAADVVCLREFAVLDLHPKPGEPPHAAVDRLLAGTWPAGRGCKVTEDDLKIAFMGDPHRWRHPTSLTLWEARIACCDGGCGNAERDRCQVANEGRAKALHSALSRAVPPPLAVTQVDLDHSPAKARHVPAFEGALAALPSPPQLLRYTAFAHEAAFAKMPFRRTDLRLEAAALPLPLGALTPPVRTVWGWSVAMLVARRPARLGGLKDPATRRAIHRALCDERSVAARLAYRTRMLSKAILSWDHGAISRRYGEAVVAKLPTPQRRPVPTITP